MSRRLRPPTCPALIAALHAEAAQTGATPQSLQAQLTGAARITADYWTPTVPLDRYQPRRRQLALNL